MKPVVLITVFNEEANLGNLLNEVSRAYDVYVVDDGSTDRTGKIAEELGAHVISLPINVGQGAATIAGYNVVLNMDYDIIVKMDGDGQHDPQEINSFVEAMRAGHYDIVVGSRRLGSNQSSAPFFRKTFLPVYTWIINKLTGYEMTDAMCGFRAFRCSSLERVSQILDTLIEPQYMASEMFIRFARAGLTVSEVPINMRDRGSGSSYKGFIRYGFGVLRAIIRTLLDRSFRRTKINRKGELIPSD
jgi:glycosyltransferase involved in cell wall biosynthesis